MPRKTGLHISSDLTLPYAAVTETFAILAKRGKGKTNTAVVMTEEMILAGETVVVIDPVGVWWGLRASASGTEDGLPVVIFGGDHGDVALEETAGALIADLVVEKRTSVVIDLSLLRKGASRRFMTDFIETLYHRNRDPLHVIVDEADAFAPQRAQADGARLLGAMEDLVRRGRARGIGCTLITQRPAVINKDVLTQAEVLIALGMTGVQDVAAIDAWVKQHADDDQARTVKASLPSLPVGTAWVWSPGWLGELKKVKIRARRTFDSSATPVRGQRRAAPMRMAEIDLEALGAQIQATVEKHKAEDPRALQKRILELQNELAQAQAAQPEPEIIEVAVISDEVLDRLTSSLGDAVKAVHEVEAALAAHSEVRLTGPRKAGKSPMTASIPTVGQIHPKPPRAPRAEGANDSIGKAERAILTLLAQHGGLTHSQLSLLSGYRPTASTIGVALSKLRKVGFVEPAGTDAVARATEDGLRTIAGNFEPLPTGEDLMDYWRARFGKAERYCLDVLIDAHPRAVDHAEMCEATGYRPTASTVGVAMSKLRKVGVVDGWSLSQDFVDAVGL